MGLGRNGACEKVLVPRGDASFDAQAVFSGGSSQQVPCHVLEGGGALGNVEARLALDFGVGTDADLAHALDHDDALEPQPVVALPQARDVVDHRGDPGFHPPVALFHRLVTAGDGVGEVPRCLLGDEQPDIVVRGSLIGIQRQNVDGAVGDDLVGDLALTPDGVDRHRRPIDLQQIQELRNGNDLVGFIRHLGLT